MPFCALVRILIFVILTLPCADLYAQNKAALAAKLMDEAKKEPQSNMNVSRLNTAVMFLSDALKEKGINCYTDKEEVEIGEKQVSISSIVISTDGEHYLNKFAKTMEEMNVELVFNPYDMLTRNAAATFDPAADEHSKSKIGMDREFIENYGSSDKVSIKHEMRHFLTYILRAMGYDSVFAGGLVFKTSTNPEEAYSMNFHFDELPAWTETVYEGTRRFHTSFKKLYLGFHPEIKSIMSSLNLYVADNIAEGDKEYQKAKKDILNFIYAYAYNIEDNESRIKKLDNLLSFFYFPSDNDKKTEMRKNILALANRDIMTETDVALKDPSANYHDFFALGRNLNNVKYLLASVKESSTSLDQLATRSITSLNSILSRRGTLSYASAVKEDYKSAWKYPSGMTVNYDSEHHNTTNNTVHIFDVETSFGIELYHVSITSNDKNVDLKELLFNRMEEQIAKFSEIKEQNKKVTEKIEEYQSLFIASETKNLSAQEIASILRTTADEVIELSKDLSTVSKESFSNDIEITEAVKVWKKYLASIAPELSAEDVSIEQTVKTKQSTEAKDDYQFCQYDFENQEQEMKKSTPEKKIKRFNSSLMAKKQISLIDAAARMNEYLGTSGTDYLELLKSVTKNIADNDFKIGDSEITLFFGENNSGGLYDYLKQNNSIKEYQTYIILFGAILYDEQNIALLDITTSNTIINAFRDIGSLDLTTSTIIEDLETKDFIPLIKVENITKAVDFIKTSSTAIIK